MQVTTIGLDLAKHVFQVHGVDAEQGAVLCRRLRPSEVVGFFASLPACVVGMESCATVPHCARELERLGHWVRLMRPSYVKPYVKRGKTDSADAEAICETVTRPTMRFVPVKTADQQAALVVHRTHDLLVRQRTLLINALRRHMAEFGIAPPPRGTTRVGELVAEIVVSEDSGQLPRLARQALLTMVGELKVLGQKIKAIEAEIMASHRANEASRRLATIAGIGPITASAIVATVADPAVFHSGRQLAAGIGLVPRQNSSGGKERLSGISKQGDPPLRICAGFWWLARQR